MRICIDSNQFIFGIGGTDPAAEMLMSLLDDLDVVLPSLVIKEVSRNLSESQIKTLFSLFGRSSRMKIVYEPVPVGLVQKYVGLGLPEKADAFIGAFAEWQRAEYLISENRHFLSELSGAAFEVLRPEEFLYRHYRATL